MNWKDEIVSVISKTHAAINEDELAFLALTSKIENPLRDKIAFEFYKRLKDNKIVCREYSDKEYKIRRADLAILSSNGEPECIIEFKAHSDLKDIGQWGIEMRKDIVKSQNTSSEAEIFFVFFVNYMTELPSEPKAVDKAIKYYKSLKQAISSSWDEEKLINEWKNSLKKNNLNSNYELIDIEAGKYYSSSIKIKIFIHGPFKEKI